MYKKGPVGNTLDLKMKKRGSTLAPKKFHDVERYGEDQVNVHVGLGQFTLTNVSSEQAGDGTFRSEDGSFFLKSPNNAHGEIKLKSRMRNGQGS